VKKKGEARSTEFKGVSFLTSRRNRFHAPGTYTSSIEARITKTGKAIGCGTFNTAREAALARDKKILSLGIDEPLQILKPKK
jgi:hypothetical protein